VTSSPSSRSACAMAAADAPHAYLVRPPRRGAKPTPSPARRRWTPELRPRTPRSGDLDGARIRCRPRSPHIPSATPLLGSPREDGTSAAPPRGASSTMEVPVGEAARVEFLCSARPWRRRHSEDAARIDQPLPLARPRAQRVALPVPPRPPPPRGSTGELTRLLASLRGWRKERWR
jgi:hypothetical protein